jgi:nicotinamide riboside kinase
MFGTDFTPDVLLAIAQGHRAALAAIMATAPDLIIEDTDIITTAAWARMLHGGSKVLAKLPATAGLYLLFAPDVPFIADGTRQFDGAERRRFQSMIEAEFRDRQIKPEKIGGDFATREAQAITAIENWLLRTRVPAA